jgi:hypothetical protein
VQRLAGAAERGRRTLPARKMLGAAVMTVLSWLVLAWITCTGVSYLLWCLERLPRTRRLLALVAVPCFVAAVGLRAELFSWPWSGLP